MVNFHLAGLGTAVPPRVLEQSDAAESSPAFCAADARQARALRILYGRSGVETRNTVVLRADEGTLQERVPFYPAASGPEDRGPTTGERMAWYEAEAPPLAESAARRALEDASTPVEAITHLVTVSCTGFFSPGLDALIDAHRRSGAPPHSASHTRGIHGVPRGPQRDAGGRVAGVGSRGTDSPLCR